MQYSQHELGICTFAVAAVHVYAGSAGQSETQHLRLAL